MNINQKLLTPEIDSSGHKKFYHQLKKAHNVKFNDEFSFYFKCANLGLFHVEGFT